MIFLFVVSKTTTVELPKTFAFRTSEFSSSEFRSEEKSNFIRENLSVFGKIRGFRFLSTVSSYANSIEVSGLGISNVLIF